MSGAVTITCKCVACRHEAPFDPPPLDQPMCPKCFSPMYAIKATRRV